MSESSWSWLRDDAPLKHKIVRFIFFLSSFSWTFNPIQDYMGESTPIEKIFTRMIPMFIVGIYCITSEHRDMLKRIFRPGMWPLLWYVLFGVFCGISSVTPALCAWKGLEIFIAIMFITVSCRDADSTKKEFVAFVRLYEGLLWVTILLAVINPALGLRHSPSIIPWIQSYIPIVNPNALGFISVLCLARLLFLPARAKPLRMIITSGVLLCAQSRTSYVVTLFILILFIINGLRTRQYSRVVLASVFSIAALALILGWHESLLGIFMRGQSSEELESLSGRTDYWEFSLRYVSWLGNGLATGSRSLIFIGEETFHKGSVNLHNSYIEALMGAGYVGALPFFMMFILNVIRQGAHAVTRRNVFEELFFICAIIFVARSFTSIVFALYSFDFNNMLIFWSWLYTHNIGVPEKPVITRPKPRAYDKTLHEQQIGMEQITCQSLQS